MFQLQKFTPNPFLLEIVGTRVPPPRPHKSAPAHTHWPRLTVIVGEQVFADADYLNSLLGSLPGVDPSDPALQSTLQDLAGDSSAPPKPDEKDDKKEGQ